MSIFSKVIEKRPKRSKKNLSHDSIYTSNFGRLTPVNVQELTANDVSRFHINCYVQPVSMPTPAFAKVRVRTRTFAVPHRLVYPDIDKFLAGEEGYREPYTTIADLCVVNRQDYYNSNKQVYSLTDGELNDFFGLPTLPFTGYTDPITGVTVGSAQAFASVIKKGSDVGDQEIKLMKHLCYLKIWNDWYRDENYQDDWSWFFDAIRDLPNYPYISASDVVTDPDGNTHLVLGVLCDVRFVSTGKDYFAGALPFQQKGSILNIFGGQKAPIIGENLSGSDWVSTGYKNINSSVNDVTDHTIQNASSTAPNKFAVQDGQQYGLDLYADLAAANGMTIVEFRTMLAAQRWEERNARGGTRYAELLRSRFGSHVPDAYVQRSVYVGGTFQDLKIDTIFQTAPTEGTNLGDYAGRAYSAGTSPYYGFHTFEPCYLITLQSIVPQPFYYQGINRDLMRFNVFDFVNPEFARVGEQPVKSTEYFFDYAATNLDREAIFGYVPRYSDFMVHNDEIHGEFRHQLQNWHTAMNIPLMQPQPEMELTEQILNQDYYREANRIFNVTPTNEVETKPFRCLVHVEHHNTTCLPKNPAAII